MITRCTIPVWLGIILVSAFFLIGQQTWEPTTQAPAPVPKTGQTVSQVPGDDGDLQRGVAWPVPRFADNSDGTATDKLTGLIWLKDGECSAPIAWLEAIQFCNTLSSGSCGLSDGSTAGAWRLPNVKELQSLLDYGRWYMALPEGHPFILPVNWFWSSTSEASHPTEAAWMVDVGYGRVGSFSKADQAGSVLCVRGPQ